MIGVVELDVDVDVDGDGDGDSVYLTEREAGLETSGG